MECPLAWEKTHTNLGTEKARHACSPRLSLSMYRQVQNKKIIYKVMKTEHILRIGFTQSFVNRKTRA